MSFHIAVTSCARRASCPARHEPDKPAASDRDQLPGASAVSAWIDLFALAIGIFSMADLNNPNCQFIVLDRINNSISALADTIPFPAGQFFTTGRARIFGKQLNAIKDFLEIFSGYRLEIFFYGSLEEDVICGHLFSIS
jgi:hypothetical protein